MPNIAQVNFRKVALNMIQPSQDQLRARAFYQFHRDLSGQRQTLSGLFYAARDFETKSNELVPELVNASKDPNWSVRGRVNEGPGIPILDQIEAHTFARDDYAGCVAVVLNNTLRALRRGFAAEPEWANLPLTKYGFTIPKIVAAISDNFRHYDEWETHKASLSRKQIGDIKVLAAIFGVALAADYSDHTFGVNVAWLAVNELSGGSYERLEEMVKQVSEDLITLGNTAPSPWLDYGRSLTS